MCGNERFLSRSSCHGSVRVDLHGEEQDMRLKLQGAALMMMLVAASALHVYAEPPIKQRLTLGDAIRQALKSNFSVLVSRTRIEESEGTRERRLSVLLPRATANALTNLQNRNLTIFGISVPGIPTSTPAFSYFDFRFGISQALVDREAYHDWKASIDQEQSARLDYQDTRDLVIRQAAGLYLDAESALAAVQTAESRLATSHTLEKLTRDQHEQGLATGVDVARAQVQELQDRQHLLARRNNYQTSLLVLLRFLGMSTGAQIELAEQLEFNPVQIPDVEQALPGALGARRDYQALLSRRQALGEQQRASRARYLPKLWLNGDYGALGRNFGEMPGIGQIQGVISIPLFDRDREGEQRELEGRIHRLNEQLDDLARGIEVDLRKAVLDLQVTKEQVIVVDATLDLAKRELSLAEDRFRNGVTDNIEVITAQNTLAAAEDDRIAAVARYADARMALARALGETEKSYESYLGQP